ncbi:hypothetical protein KCU95_g11211, partial [Aureobasidium melanogenum]
MASTSETTLSAPCTDQLKYKQAWRRNVWKQDTVAHLLNKDNSIVELKSKEKKTPEVRRVHKALLCFYSPYHDRLLNGEFAEALAAPTKPLVINAGASVLELLLTWLYTGQVNMGLPIEGSNDGVEQWHIGTAKLYIFADELNCVALQRSIMSKLVESCKTTPNLVGLDTIEFLSDSSLESSRLYQYYVDVFDAHWNGKLDAEIDSPNAEDPMPPHFAYRLLLRRFRRLEDNNPDCVCCHDPCKYHGHESEEERKATCGALDVEFEDKQREVLNFDSESESDTELQSAHGKKRTHEDGESDTSKKKHVKTT